jgi:biotin carboxylase
MSNSWIILLGADENCVLAAQKEGFNVFLIQKFLDLNFTAIKVADESLIIDYEKEEIVFPILKSIVALRPVSGIWSFTEYGLMPAAVYAKSLGVTGQSVKAVNMTRNKNAMRKRLEEIGISPVKYAFCNSVDEAITSCTMIGYPVVLKAVDGVHKLGLQFVNSETELCKYFPDVQNNLNSLGVLIEEYLDGPEISVEGIVINGEPNIVTITDKEYIPPYFNETSHSLPSLLPNPLQSEIRTIASDVLRAVHYELGIFHLEFRVTKNGPKLIEAHTRPGGDRVWDLVKMVFNLDVYQLFFQALNGQVNKVSANPKGGASIKFFFQNPGIVKSINHVEKAKLMTNIVDVKIKFKPGDLAPIPKRNDDRAGYVIAFSNSSTNEAILSAQKALDLIEIETEVDPTAKTLV